MKENFYARYMITKKKAVWIVEVNWRGDKRDWQPTVGIGLNRDDARCVFKNWQSRNPDDQFRLRKYVPVEVAFGAREFAITDPQNERHLQLQRLARFKLKGDERV